MGPGNAATGICSRSSLAYDASGQAAISYDLAPPGPSNFKQIHLARRNGCAGSCWQDELVDDVTPLVTNELPTSLAFSPTGSAAISYGVYPPQVLKFAMQIP